MRIWLVNPYGPLPGEEWREYRFSMIARALTARGHEVVWWTAAFDHFTKSRRVRGWKTVEASARFRIILVPTPAYKRNIGLMRIVFECVFAAELLRGSRRELPPDVIVAADPPQIAGGLVAVLLRKRTKAALVFDCLDLWPEVFEGAFPASVRRTARRMLAPLRWLRRFTYRRASGVVAAAETYRQLLLREVRELDSSTTAVVYLGIDPSPFVTLQPMDGRPFTCIYAGSLGSNHDVAAILEAAANLTHFRFTIAGGGPLADMVAKTASTLPNTSYLGRVPAADLPALYASSDAGLIPYAPWSTVALPVKLFDYLAAGLPVVSSIKGELEELIREHDCGVTYRAGDAKSLADAIRLLAADETRRLKMAENARQCARQFERDEQYRRFADFVERIAAQHSRNDGSRRRPGG